MKKTKKLRAKLEVLEKRPDARQNANCSATIAMYYEQIYYNENSKSDLLTALTWWKIANKLGALDAALGLGNCYLALATLDRNKDYFKMAVDYLNDASRKGISQADELLSDLQAVLSADGGKIDRLITKKDKLKKKRHIVWFIMAALFLYSGYLFSYGGCYFETMKKSL